MTKQNIRHRRRVIKFSRPGFDRLIENRNRQTGSTVQHHGNTKRLNRFRNLFDPLNPDFRLF